MGAADTLRLVLASFTGSIFQRAMTLATTHRVLRCNEGDVAALALMRIRLGVWAGAGATSDGLLHRGRGQRAGAFQHASSSSSSKNDREMSFPLLWNVAFSELEEEPAVSRNELRSLMSDALFTTFYPGTHRIYDSWPRYARDELVGAYPDTDVPVLIMNGTLDSATPIDFAETVAPHYTRPGQVFVSMPRATHAVVHASPTIDGRSCGMDVWLQFIASRGRGALDTSCTERIMPHALESRPGLATYFFGTPDLWDSPPVTTSPLPEAEADAIAEEFLRNVETTDTWYGASSDAAPQRLTPCGSTVTSVFTRDAMKHWRRARGARAAASTAKLVRRPPAASASRA